MKLPDPEPSLVLLFEVVGPEVVLQQTPLDNTADPPSEVILPPLDAVEEVIADKSVLVKIGIIAKVVKVT